ncbi:MAG: hypothetical protein K1X65_11935 [Caldilineales bacterium]|nr:hypothetical protein [Caldilineales bacterium]
MIVPATLTPFSRSVILEALQSAHRRQSLALGCQPHPGEAADAAILWDQQALAGLVVQSWGVENERIAHLTGLPASPVAAAGRGPRHGAKAADELAAELPARQERLRGWARRVFAMRWSQAQLLQVMEEIEPLTTDACLDEQGAAAAALGSYASLCELASGWKLGPTALLDIVAGIETPTGTMVADLLAGLDAEALLARYGHRGDTELELAASRLAETGFGAPPADESGATAWQPAVAQARRGQAEAELSGQAGLLRRGAVRKAIAQAQAMLKAHGQAEDGLAWVLAAVRRWALAAGSEGAKDGRLDSVEDIFWLELEEIKQMMTGEWHSRDHVQPLISERRQARAALSGQAASPSRPLGIAGGSLTAPFQRLDSPTEALIPGAILVAERITPAWAPAIGRAAGLVVERGDFLCQAAAVGRAGGLPTLVAAAKAAPAAMAGILALDPAHHQAALAA